MTFRHTPWGALAASVAQCQHASYGAPRRPVRSIVQTLRDATSAQTLPVGTIETGQIRRKVVYQVTAAARSNPIVFHVHAARQPPPLDDSARGPPPGDVPRAVSNRNIIPTHPPPTRRRNCLAGNILRKCVPSHFEHNRFQNQENRGWWNIYHRCLSACAPWPAFGIIQNSEHLLISRLNKTKDFYKHPPLPW